MIREMLRSSLVVLLSAVVGSGMFVGVSANEIKSGKDKATDPKHVLIIAGEASHGWNEHEFPQGVELLSDCLNEAEMGITSEYVVGWPEGDEAVFEDIDALVIYSDGGNSHPANGHVDVLQSLKRKGCGFAIIHYALEPRDKEAALHAFLLESIGGCFEVDWSVNPIWEVKNPLIVDHEITHGVQPFQLSDEWYYHMRFSETHGKVTPLLSALPDVSVIGADGPRSGNATLRKELENGIPQVLAWSFEANTPDKHRGFGFTGGHYHTNWEHDDFRKLVLNGIVWTAGVEIPEEGIRSEVAPVLRHQTIERAIGKKDLEDIQRHIDLDPEIVNRPGRGNYTPLHVAILRKNVDALKLILENGADPNRLTSSKESPLHLVVKRNLPTACGVLVEFGANPSLLDKQGWTALHNAAAQNKVEVARVLLENGAQLNVLSNGGGTPLHEAAASAGTEMIQLFLDHGVDPSVRSKTGVTALDIAIEFENQAAIEALSNIPGR